MRLLYPTLALCFAGLSVVASGALTPRKTVTPLRTASTTNGEVPCKIQGVASCASMACHGATGPRGSAGSEYSTWIAVDKHAKAFEVLSLPESLRMHKNLAQSDKAYQKYSGPTENPLCLKCHGMGVGPGVSPAMQADGVGCERCHGPAEHWKTTHYLDGFNRATPGFHDLRNLVDRARTCTKCHVGNAEQEVNHDLIAAGHPRLRFDFGAYYSILPRHWDDSSDKAGDPAFESRAWAVGQLVGAEAALELLASRTKGKDPITGEPKPWPEFSEYECAACHHGLTKPSARQERDYERAKAGKLFRSGDLPWGTWYHTLLPLLAERVPGAEAKKLAALRGELEANLRKRLPPQTLVASQAREAADLIRRWLASANRPVSGKQALALFDTLAEQKDLVGSGWDSATQVYLGLAANHNALCDAVPGFQARTPFRVPLLDMRKKLRDSFDKEARPLYDSPLKFDDNRKGLLEDLRIIRELPR
jgi:hypothetical protein